MTHGNGHPYDAVHVFVPTIYPNDGIGGHVLRLAEAQRRRGHRSEIFVQIRHPATAHLCHPIEELDARVGPGSVVFVYQNATGSTLPSILAPRPEPLVTQHQGLTPLELLAPWSTEAVGELTLGRRQLEDLAKVSEMGVGTSSHNVAELDQLGFRRTALAPVMLPPVDESAPPVPRPASATPTVLFVGRITPNKAQHDLIESLAVLQTIVPQARLRLVGSDATPTYRRALERLVASLGLESVVDFVGTVDDATLVAEYRHADVFCCLSDHEGFGVPLIEASAHGLPVVAFDTTAVGETLGSGGILLSDKEPGVVATALARVLHDEALRARMVAAGWSRALELGPERAADALDAALAFLHADLDAMAAPRTSR